MAFKLEMDELQIYQVQAAKEALLDAYKSDHLTLDLSNIENIDIAGLQLLVSFAKTLESQQHVFSITGANESVCATAALEGVDRILKLVVE